LPGNLFIVCYFANRLVNSLEKGRLYSTAEVSKGLYGFEVITGKKLIEGQW